MTRNRSRGPNRPSFTLIELLIVIAIIAILVSLTAAGVMKTLGKIPEVQTRTEISQMDAALAAFMSDYNLTDPPPSLLMLRENNAYNTANPIELRTKAFLSQAFGKNLGPVDWNGNGTIDNSIMILQGHQCLVFYLGGIPSPLASTPAGLGFSTNKQNPAFPGGKRNGPYFPFNTSRLVRSSAANPFMFYIDAYKAQSGPKPYAYFSAYGVNNGYVTTDCTAIGALPYHQGTIYTNSNKYQIISAGKDGAFGLGAWTPSLGAQDVNGRDDQANFSSLLLGNPQQ